MAQTDNKTSLSSEEKRSLAESARLCEMIVEANPSDTGALETLKEIYTKLGDRESLARVVARLAGTVGGRPSASVAPAPEPAAGRVPATEEMEALAASIEVAPTPSPGKRGGASPIERRQGSLSRLGDRLVAEKLISPDQLQRALAEQKGSADKLGTILVRLNFITEDSLVSFLSKQYAMPAITVAQVDPDPDVLKLVPEQIAKKHSVLPIKRIGNVLTLAMADPTNVFALDDVGFMTGLQIQPVVASEAAIRKAFERLYETGASVNDMISELEEADTDVEVVEDGEAAFSKADVFDLKESADEAPVVRLINMILTDAIRRGASDIQAPRGRPDLAREDHGHDGHRGAPASPGRPHQAALPPARDRLPSLDPADDLR